MPVPGSGLSAGSVSGRHLRKKNDLGTLVDRYLFTKGFYLRFKDGKFIIKDESDQIVFETKTDDPIDEAVQFVLTH